MRIPRDLSSETASNFGKGLLHVVVHRPNIEQPRLNVVEYRCLARRGRNEEWKNARD